MIHSTPFKGNKFDYIFSESHSSLGNRKNVKKYMSQLKLYNFLINPNQTKPKTIDTVTQDKVFNGH
jgi:hypothetical protein